MITKKKYPTLANNYTALFFSITVSGNETVQILSKILHSLFSIPLATKITKLNMYLLFCYIYYIGRTQLLVEAAELQEPRVERSIVFSCSCVTHFSVSRKAHGGTEGCGG